jgi:predicted  nucleic acid-binding Zn-ribbon protein
VSEQLTKQIEQLTKQLAACNKARRELKEQLEHRDVELVKLREMSDNTDAELKRMESEIQNLRNGFSHIVANSAQAEGETEWALSVAYEMLSETENGIVIRSETYAKIPKK